MLNLNVQEIRDNQDDRDSKAEVGQSNSKRRSRTAAIHNQSERVITKALLLLANNP